MSANAVMAGGVGDRSPPPPLSLRGSRRSLSRPRCLSRLWDRSSDRSRCRSLDLERDRDLPLERSRRRSLDDEPRRRPLLSDDLDLARRPLLAGGGGEGDNLRFSCLRSQSLSSCFSMSEPMESKLTKHKLISWFIGFSTLSSSTLSMWSCQMDCTFSACNLISHAVSIGECRDRGDLRDCVLIFYYYKSIAFF